MIEHFYDVIIIGAGGAGLVAASQSKKLGLKCAVISKVLPNFSHTCAAKGGINAALGNNHDDNWRWHAFDTIKGGDYLADKNVVEYMCQKAPEAIYFLENIGVNFSRDNNGKIYQRSYGGQSTQYGKGAIAHRACASKDGIGRTMIDSLYSDCLRQGVDFFNEFFIHDLIMEDKKCLGAVGFNIADGQFHQFSAKSTIIATGGYSQIYQNTTTSSICTGDGGGLILQEGLPLQDMEFTQFHPTGILKSGFLISEAARGEGAYLVNSQNERFMEKYDPKYKDLACRDLISRAISTEIHQGRGCGENKNGIYLQFSHLQKDIITSKLPNIIKLAQSFAQIDITKEPILIAPSLHYTMGGIPADINCKVSNSDNLYAVGEAACLSVHGANRLGCNSLLDLIVFGQKVAQSVKENNNQLINKKYAKQVALEKITKINHFLNKNHSKNTNIYQIKDQIKQISEKHIGVFRNKQLLEQGIQKLQNLYNQLQNVTISNKSLIFNDELICYLETKNLFFQSFATITSALNRNESRGAHYRQDFPKKDDKNWLSHSLIKVKSDLGYKVEKKDVIF